MANPWYYANAGPNYNPYADLAEVAKKSPYFQQAKLDYDTANVGFAGNRGEGIQSLLTQFGELPPGFEDKYGDINDVTRSAIDQSTSSGLSTVARLRQARDDAQTQMLRGLAAKGLRRSGAKGYKLRRGQLAYDQARTDAINKLLAGTQGVYKGYTDAVTGNNANLTGALNNAINQVSPYWSPSPTQNLNPYSQVGMPGTMGAITGRPHVGGPADEERYM